MHSIKLKNVSYKYPLSEKEVLKDINVELPRGKVIAIIGNNGSGKTTLCNTIRGLVPSFYKGEFFGDVEIFGKRLAEYSTEEAVKTIGYVSQNPFVQISGSRHTVFDEVAFGLENLGYDVNSIKEKTTYTIKLLNLEHLSDKDPNKLSGGQKQKVALASVIAMNPELLILDEPTSQLDPQSSREIFTITSQLKKMGKTVIIAEHKMELIAEYCDQVLLLSEGELKHIGTPELVFNEILWKHEDVMTPEYMDFIYQRTLKEEHGNRFTIPSKKKEAIKFFSKYDWEGR